LKQVTSSTAKLATREIDIGAIEAAFTEAKRVIFLGFGFWRENMAPFEALRRRDDLELWSSSYGLPSTVIQDVRAKFPRMQFGSRAHKVREFLLEEPVLSASPLVLPI